MLCPMLYLSYSETSFALTSLERTHSLAGSVHCIPLQFSFLGFPFFVFPWVSLVVFVFSMVSFVLFPLFTCLFFPSFSSIFFCCSLHFYFLFLYLSSVLFVFLLLFIRFSLFLIYSFPVLMFIDSLRFLFVCFNFRIFSLFLS